MCSYLIGICSAYYSLSIGKLIKCKKIAVVSNDVAGVPSLRLLVTHFVHFNC